MAVDLQMAVRDLLERRLVEDKIRGTAAAEIEGAAVLEAVALGLWSNPRIAHWLWHLGRNGLLSAITVELETLASLLEAVSSANRPAYAIRDTKLLEQARLALLQIEAQGSLTGSSGSYQNFTRTIDSFLEKALAKSVRVPGATDLAMSGAEAVAAIPPLLATLTEAHSSVVERLRALSVALENFESADIASFSGVTSAVRARMDLEAMIESLSADQTPSSAKEYVYRLLAAKAALRTTVERPDASIKVSSTRKFPAGRQLVVRGAPFAATVTFPKGTALGAAAGCTISDSLGGTWSAANFPLAGFDLNGRPMVVGAAALYPLPLSAPRELYVSLDGVPSRVILPDGTMAGIVAALNAVPGIHAQESFPGSNRLAVVATGASRISIEPSYWDGASLHTSDAHLYAFNVFGDVQTGVAGNWEELYGEMVSYITGGRVLTEEAPDSLIFRAQDGASTLRVQIGTFDVTETSGAQSVWLSEAGSTVPVSDHRDLVAVGDVLHYGGARYTVTSVGDGFTLTPPLPRLDVPAEVTSGIVAEVTSARAALRAQAVILGRAKWLESLAAVDRAVAVVLGQQTVGAVNACVSVLSDLRDALTVLHAALATPLAADGSSEAALAEGLLDALRGRGFNRARDFLLTGRIREIFTMDWQTASYAGEMVAAASDFANASIRWPNRAKDEGFGAAAMDE